MLQFTPDGLEALHAWVLQECRACGPYTASLEKGQHGFTVMLEPVEGPDSAAAQMLAALSAFLSASALQAEAVRA